MLASQGPDVRRLWCDHVGVPPRTRHRAGARVAQHARPPRTRVPLFAAAVVGTVALAAGGVTGLLLTDATVLEEPTVAAFESVAGAWPQAGQVSAFRGSASGQVGGLALTASVPVPQDEPVVTFEPVVASTLSAEDRMAGLLSRDEPQSAGGELVVVPGAVPAPDPSTRVYTVRVEVEEGLPIDGAKFATLVMGILNSPHGWGAEGDLSFARTDGPDPDLRVVLASPDKVDEMCAPLDTVGRYSCGTNGHAAINYSRWVSGAGAFDDTTTYRQYVVSHEVGHLLGHRHEYCPGPGQVAPVMMQQTVSVSECVTNGWPFPDVG